MRREHPNIPPRIQKYIQQAENAINDGYFTAAAEPLFQVVKALPDHPLYWIKLGQVLFRTGHLDAAADCFKQVDALQPGEPWSTFGLAGIYERQGRLKKARDLLNPLIGSPHAHAGAIGLWARVNRRLGLAKAAIKPVEKALAITRSRRDQAFLGHALGECLEATGNYEAAFKAVKAANECRRLSYDPQAHTRHVDRLIERFGAGSFGQIPRANLSSDRPVLLVGMMRCGSTLVEQILDAHPQIHAAGEVCILEEIPKIMVRESGTGSDWPDAVEKMDPAAVDRFSALYLRGLRQPAGTARRIIDKTLPNYLLLGLAAILVPGARVIHCVRNAADNCLSCYFVNLKADQAYATRLEWLGHRYRQYRRLMGHWEKVLPLPIHTVRYESLVSDTKRQVAALLDFLELPWDDRCLQHDRSNRIPQTASYAQARRKIYKDAVGRSRNYATWLGPLYDAIGDPGTPE